ncbi:MAG: hypothetical protein AAGI45_07765 [Cyanobacteria bacterium P01_H01_bin.26]
MPTSVPTQFATFDAVFGHAQSGALAQPSALESTQTRCYHHSTS